MQSYGNGELVRSQLPTAASLSPDPRLRAFDGPEGPGRGKTMSLAQVIGMLRQHALFIAGCMGAVILVVLVVTLFSRMTFRASGSLYLGELQEKGAVKSGLPEQMDLFGGEPGNVGTEIEILKSQDLLARAIRESGLNVTIAPAGWSPPRYLRWRLGHRDQAMVDRGLGEVVAVNASLGEAVGNDQRRFTVTFTDAKTFTVRQGKVLLGSGTLAKPFKAEGLQVTLLPGSAGGPRPGADYTMSVDALGPAIEEVTKRLTVSTPKPIASNDTIRIVTVEFTDRSPRRAATLVQTLMQAYLDRRQTWKSEEAIAAENFVITQVSNIKTSLDEAERKLAEYKKNSKVVVLGDDARGMIDQIGKYEQQRVAARLQVSTFERIQSALQRRDVPVEQLLVGEAEDRVLAGMSNDLAQARRELQQAQERFTEQAPAVLEQRAQIENQVRTIKSYMHGRYLRAQQQLQALDEMISQYEDKLKTVPQAESELTKLSRNADVLSKMYSFLLERQQQAAVTKASTVSRNHILDSAIMPYRESSPALGKRLLAALFGGLLLGSTLVFGRRLTSGIFQSESEVRHRLGGMIPMGTIPARRPARLGASATLSMGRSGAEAHTALSELGGTDARPAFLEAFRRLRTNIYYAAAGRDQRTILITSPAPGDGKTLCTLTLAAVLVADHKRVLLINGDLHRQGPDNNEGDGGPGLSDVLGHQADWKEVARTIETPHGTFDWIGSGPKPATPAELLSGPGFGALLTQCRSHYDYVLVDSPPFPLVSDALIMSTQADLVLSVLRLRNTPERAAEEHLRSISVASRQYGVIINDAEDMTFMPGYEEAYQAPKARWSLWSRFT